MSLNFTFALSQQQTFELRCDYGSRRLDKPELAALIDQCEQNYYTQKTDCLPDITHLGRRLYQWLDGKELQNHSWRMITGAAGSQVKLTTEILLWINYRQH
ncbi:MAG: hypothetical protein DSM106950_20835 [Stigonema ocellatum SAG 48.90 = DSM 106950]|nr:hypothetical protein [Stigonema ocellatum SAG 48.90 = DSM 106950]